jgi:hypothetical protein
MDPAVEVAYLRTPAAVRERAQALLALGEGGGLEHFAVEGAALAGVVDRVVDLMEARFARPEDVPYHSRWRHFGAGAVDRGADFDARLAAARATDDERLRARFELAITSVLLDAGAGDAWSFREAETGGTFARSEGLAVASYRGFVAGAFADQPGALRADAGGLRAVTEETLGEIFQVEAARNPLVGLASRAALLRRLGEVAAGFAEERLGGLADEILAAAPGRGVVRAPAILAAVLEHLGPIWPGRHRLGGVNLGDVWPHPQVGWVPFHKLSQWLTYSLVEPLEWAGVRVVELDGLTGLAEYRNGGLFVDGGVLRPKSAEVLGRRHAAGDPVIVEWRGLTVALLDRVAAEVRGRFGLSEAALPLAKVLEGGTWLAGRALAAERRPPAGGPPIQVDSDGTVF